MIVLPRLKPIFITATLLSLAFCSAWLQVERPLLVQLADKMDAAANHCQDSNRIEEAKFLYKGSVFLTRLSPARYQTETACSLNNLATLERDQEHLKEATGYLLESLQIFNSRWGDRHPQKARVMNNLAEVYLYRGMYDESERYAEGARAILADRFGDDSIEVAQPLSTLSDLRRAQGKFVSAKICCEKSLSILGRYYGEKHPLCLSAMGDLTCCYSALGQPKAAESLARKAHELSIEMYGKQNPKTAVLLSNLACCMQKKGDLVGAERLLRESVRLLQSHPSAQGICLSNRVAPRANLAWLLREQNKNEEAQKLEEEVQTILGANPQTILPRSD